MNNQDVESFPDANRFDALFLDNRHRVIQVVEMFQGTIDGASVHPRVVVQRSLELNAAAVVFFHNHPSGSPSRAMRTRQSPGDCGTRWRWWTYECSITSS